MVEWFLRLDRWEKGLWLLFAFTCLQAVMQQPYIHVIPGERTKILSGLLCGASFFLLVWIKQKELRFNREWAVCLLLSVLCLCSGLVSGDQVSSLWRGATMLLSSIGGFWFGRLLFQNEACQRLLVRFSLLLLAFFLGMALLGYFFHDNIFHYIRIHKHPFNNIILLLSFAPLCLVYSGKPRLVGIGILYLCVSYFVIALVEDPYIWFPPVLFIGVMLLGRKEGKKIVLLTLAAVLVAVVLNASQVPKGFYAKERSTTWIRVENYFFSYHLMTQKPLLGIGLMAPRLEYLDDYTVVYPYITKKQLEEILYDENLSSENQFLTFLCDLGIPFTLLYTVSLLGLYASLWKGIHGTRQQGPILPIILWVPITGTLLHLQFYDGLLHPQICWLFHLMLGMIPQNNG